MKNKHKFTYSKNNIQNKPKIPPKKRFRDKVKEKLNKILFWVIITAFCLFTVGSTLGTVAFFKTAKADSVEETAIYQGNSLFVPTQAFSGGAPNFGTAGGRPFLLSFDYILSLRPYVVNNNFIRNDFNFKIKAYTTSAYESLSGKDGVQGGINISKNEDWIDYTFSLADISSKGLITLYYQNVQGFTVNYGQIELRGDKEFNCNVVSVQLYSIDYTDISGKAGYWFISNIIKLIDNNGKIFTIDIPCCVESHYAPKNSLMFEERTYYNTNNFGEDINFANGLREGYDKGKIEGEEIGYNKGKAEGKEEGFAEGKAYGIAHSNDYTLYALISSIFNVPITSFVHLINFEFFGVNLANFFTGILTMAVILFVVSKLFGK